MRMLPPALIVGAFVIGYGVSAQESPTPKPPYTFETMLERIRGGKGATNGARGGSCVVPDGTQTASVNAILTIGGRTYRCVEVLDQNLEPRAVAWTPGSKPVYTSEAMLRRIAPGIAGAPTGADPMTCARPNTEAHPVNTTVTVEGRTYYCAEVLDQNLERAGAAWTPMPPRP